MINKAILVSAIFLLQSGFLKAQSPQKEAMNNFALYTKKQDFKYLETAKKSIDGAFQTRKDSFSYKNNLTKSLIYSTLAFVDSTRRLSYKKDPIDETLLAFGRLESSKLNDEHKPEINFIRKQLSNAFLIRANKALKEFDYESAYDAYRWVDSLSSGKNPQVKQNLAIISQRLGYRLRAIGYYEQLIADKQSSSPVYYLTLASFYEMQGDENKALEVVKEGAAAFPKNKDLLFKELNFYVDKGAYNAIIDRVKDALALEPDNEDLNYIAGFAYQVTGRPSMAEEYYKKVISLDPNNYDANYSLGLFYLQKYIESDKDDAGYSDQANYYLNKSSEINPNSVKALRSLSILYQKTGDLLKLEQINNKLNQIILY